MWLAFFFLPHLGLPKPVQLPIRFPETDQERVCPRRAPEAEGTHKFCGNNHDMVAKPISIVHLFRRLVNWKLECPVHLDPTISG